MAEEVTAQSRADTVLGHIKAAGQAALAEGEKIAKEIVQEVEHLEHEVAGDFEFELGATVLLFERNHDPVTSAPLEGYQAPLSGKIVKITEDSSNIDILTGGTDSPAITHHDIPHYSQADNGENYWDEPGNVPA